MRHIPLKRIKFLQNIFYISLNNLFLLDVHLQGMVSFLDRKSVGFCSALRSSTPLDQRTDGENCHLGRQDFFGL